jgi:hypothetical protein
MRQSATGLAEQTTDLEAFPDSTTAYRRAAQRQEVLRLEVEDNVQEDFERWPVIS